MRHFRSKENTLREAIRGILREEAGAGKIDELIGKIEGINAEISKYYAWRAEKEGEVLDPEDVPRFGIYVSVDPGYGANIMFAIRGTTYTGEIEPGNILSISSKNDASLMGDTLDTYLPYGKIALGNNDHNPCLGAWSIEQTFPTKDGWGPLLYDIAIEIATQEAGGLMSDRNEVSAAARKVWYTYKRVRGDIEQAQLDISDDDLENWMAEDEGQEPLKHLTPDVSEDDCTQWSALQDRGEDADWFESPLSRVYKKPPLATSRLESMGLLFRGALER